MLVPMLRGILMALASLSLLSCASDYRDFGQYRVAVQEDHMFGLVCQPRQEFYFLGNVRDDPQPVYLGTCGTPGFITDQMHMPGDPSCFALATDGKGIVYYHRPEICGAGDRAKNKPGGIYVHSALGGDRLLYPDTQFSQVWSADPIPQGAMRIMWIAKTPSETGARCAQNVVVHADGREEAEGRPDPSSPMCKLR